MALAVGWAVVGCQEQPRVVGVRFGNISASPTGTAQVASPAVAPPVNRSATPASATPAAAPSGDSGGGDWLGSLFGGGGGDATETGSWAVALGEFKGSGSMQNAQRRRDQLVSQTGEKGLWVWHEGERATVLFGHYKSLTDPHAKSDLKHWRDLRARGLPIDAALLVPVTPGEGAHPEFNLTAAPPGTHYTLQIGFYDPAFGPDFRKAAEKAAAILRSEGVQAFYYHGPNRSMITVGTFGDKALVSPDDKEYSYDVRALQRRFPFNLGNGVTLREKRPDGTLVNQPSFLVHIPDR